MVVEDGVVTRLFLVRNPDKLGAVGEEVGLTR
jgi:RNA polymerase sigma-70 factor (ECF subfamily)